MSPRWRLTKTKAMNLQKKASLRQADNGRDCFIFWLTFCVCVNLRTPSPSRTTMARWSRPALRARKRQCLSLEKVTKLTTKTTTNVKNSPPSKQKAWNHFFIVLCGMQKQTIDLLKQKMFAYKVFALVWLYSPYPWIKPKCRTKLPEAKTWGWNKKRGKGNMQQDGFKKAKTEKKQKSKMVQSSATTSNDNFRFCILSYTRNWQSSPGHLNEGQLSWSCAHMQVGLRSARVIYNH